MSYTPTEWKTGDIISAEKMNKIEQGIANAGSIDFLRFDDDGKVTTVDNRLYHDYTCPIPIFPTWNIQNIHEPTDEEINAQLNALIGQVMSYLEDKKMFIPQTQFVGHQLFTSEVFNDPIAQDDFTDYATNEWEIKYIFPTTITSLLYNPRNEGHGCYMFIFCPLPAETGMPIQIKIREFAEDLTT